MGQYFYIVNLDKKEFLYPHKLGSGLKLGEICNEAIMSCMAHLLSTDSGPGHQGAWSCDRITIAGDYAGDGVYEACSQDEEGPPSSYRDISLEVREEVPKHFPWVKFDKQWGAPR